MNMIMNQVQNTKQPNYLQIVYEELEENRQNIIFDPKLFDKIEKRRL